MPRIKLLKPTRTKHIKALKKKNFKLNMIYLYL